MIPLRSDNYEYHRDLSLTIRKVELTQLGPYVCQAYTGQGKGVSYTVTVKAVGPVHTDLINEKPFLKYVLDVPLTPQTQRPVVGVPYRPTPTPPRYIPRPPQRTMGELHWFGFVDFISFALDIGFSLIMVVCWLNFEW